MSHEATKWAFDQPEAFPDMKPGEWAVLVVLANCHNPVFGCFPSQAYLARKTNLKERAVRDQLVRLRERGLIDWEETRDEGHRGSNRYALAFEDDFQPAKIAGRATGKKLQEQPAKNDTSNRQNLPADIIEPVREESLRESLTRAREAAPGSGNERESEGGYSGSAQDPQMPDPDDPTEAAKRWRRLKVSYPQAIKDDLPKAEKLFLACSAGEQMIMLEAMPRLKAYLDSQSHARRIRLQEFIEQRGWELIPDPPEAQAAAAPAAEAQSGFAHLGFADQGWWAMVWRDFRAGRLREFRLRTYVNAAHGIGVRTEDAPGEAELAALVRIDARSAEFDAWAAHVEAAFRPSGLPMRLPRPDKVPFVWVPSQWPPDADQRTMNEAEEAMR